MRRDRVAQPRAALLEELRLVVVPHRQRPRPGEPLQRERRPPPRSSTWPGGSLRISRKIESGPGTQFVARNASSASRSRSPFGSASSSEANESSPSATAVVERLDPEPVAREHEPLARSRPRSRPRTSRAAARQTRAPTARRRGRSSRCPTGVAHPVAGALELAAQLGVVVDLAVLDDGARPVLVRDRLVARLEVDDREPPRREPDAALRRTSRPSPARGGRASRTSRRAASRSTRPREETIPQIPHIGSESRAARP